MMRGHGHRDVLDPSWLVPTVCEFLETRRLFAAGVAPAREVTDKIEKLALVHQELHRPPTALADLNGDGLDDLIMARGGVKESVSIGLGFTPVRAGFDVYVNNGDGTFTFAGGGDCDDTDAERASTPGGIAIGDVDRDGDLDVALKLYSVTGQPTPVGEVGFDAHVVVFDGTGKGEFTARKSFVLPHIIDSSTRYATDPYVETSQRGIGIGDLDGDGMGDIVSWELDGIVVGHSQGGTVGPPFRLDGTKSQDDGVLGVADLDGDGRSDIVIAGVDAVRYVAVDFSSGGEPKAGKVSKIDSFTIKQGVAVHLGDVDGDGLGDDLIAVDGQTVSFGVNTQTVDRTGTPIHSFSWTQVDGPLAGATRSIMIGDVDGDGYDELFTIVVKASHEVAMNSIRNMKG